MTRTSYRICPRCSRAVPIQSKEAFCINDGTRLLEKCPSCQANITSPHARYCQACGFHYPDVLEREEQKTS